MESKAVKIKKVALHMPGLESPYRIPTSTSLVLRGNFMLMISMITWAAGFPAADYLLHHGWGSLLIINMRYILVIGVLLPLWIFVDGPRAVLDADWIRGLWVGGISFGFGAYLLIVAQYLTDPVLVAIIAAAMPIAATTIEVFHKERVLKWWFFWGLVFTVFGGVIAAGQAQAASFSLGILLAVIATFLFAWGSHATVRSFPKLTTLGRMTITFSGGFVAVVLAAAISLLLGHELFPVRSVTLYDLGMISIYSFSAIMISQYFWLRGVERLGIALASFHINTAPFYVMLFLLVLGSAWSWTQAIGASFVAFGVLLAQLRR
jgi:drug/metabolite transporter (DMT)-like permease